MTSDHTSNQPFGGFLVSSRALGEYRAMFALTDADLRRRLLDCPGGAAGFTAAVRGLGGDVTACDLAYANGGTAEVAATAADEVVRGNDYVRAHPEQFRFTYFADPGEHLTVRQRAAELFAAHSRAEPDRYVAGTLPGLPFGDNAFDLVLSSHLLFSYAADLDYAFHLAAVRELLRVGTEARIFPLVPIGADERYRDLDRLLADLREHGIEGRIVDVDYEFQAGAHQMLVCRKPARP
ncbi:hypothetical protein [Nocardia sp. NPDC050718]|uniref:hypothetical protein n=1 Tax=Nocardia sp. NPDC050718 TaxID=3155788 RepID=UPI0033F38897